MHLKKLSQVKLNNNKKILILKRLTQQLESIPDSNSGNSSSLFLAEAHINNYSLLRKKIKFYQT